MILDGKETAAALSAALKEKLAGLAAEHRLPSLAVVLVGEDKPSAMYAAHMLKIAEGYGISAKLISKSADISEEELIGVIRALNEDAAVTGILTMMPLPAHITESHVIEAMDPDKDIDGLTSANLGRLMAGKDGLFPCTPRACMEILHHYKIPIDGKRAVVLGRSIVVGNPVAQLLQKENATVTVCHSHTKNMAEICREADILVAAMGRAEAVTADMIRPGAVVIDVGINRKDGKTVGDVCYNEALPKAGAITPVPGGVGSVTTTMVIEALIHAAELQKK